MKVKLQSIDDTMNPRCPYISLKHIGTGCIDCPNRISFKQIDELKDHPYFTIEVECKIENELKIERMKEILK